MRCTYLSERYLEEEDLLDGTPVLDDTAVVAVLCEEECTTKDPSSRSKLKKNQYDVTVVSTSSLPKRPSQSR